MVWSYINQIEKRLSKMKYHRNKRCKIAYFSKQSYGYMYIVISYRIEMMIAIINSSYNSYNPFY